MTLHYSVERISGVGNLRRAANLLIHSSSHKLFLWLCRTLFLHLLLGLVVLIIKTVVVA